MIAINKKIVVAQVLFLLCQFGLIYFWMEKREVTHVVRCAQEKPCMNPAQLGLIIRYLENVINVFNKYL